ncbi:hypothetical protein Hanom_Chr10g00959821 [Helianthus anomalus]
MDGVNEPDENGKISNLLNSDAKKQTLKDENGILLKNIRKNHVLMMFIVKCIYLLLMVNISSC